MLNRFRKYFQSKEQMTRFSNEFAAFRSSELKSVKRFPLRDEDVQPCLNDNTPVTDFDRHYVYHIAWACRVVKEINPALHIDFSSSLYFCTTISAFIRTEFYDFRPAELGLSGLKSQQGDLTKIPLTDNSVESISCMHTVEHVGLGRYGDPIDYDGDLKAVRELTRVVRPGGSLLFVTPVGQPRIRFNAHRIYSYEQVIHMFDGFELKEFSLIPDHAKDGGLVRNATAQLADQQKYGCGCFWFVKKQ